MSIKTTLTFFLGALSTLALAAAYGQKLAKTREIITVIKKVDDLLGEKEYTLIDDQGQEYIFRQYHELSRDFLNHQWITCINGYGDVTSMVPVL